jgi:hypothetical protein
MLSIYESWMIEGNTLPVHIIRYNPHAFQVDGKSAKVMKKDREAQLLEVINEAAETASSDQDLQVQYVVRHGRWQASNHAGRSIQHRRLLLGLNHCVIYMTLVSLYNCVFVCPLYTPFVNFQLPRIRRLDQHYCAHTP